MDSDQQRPYDQDFFNKQEYKPIGTEKDASGITIGIYGHESKGSALKKHTVYLIKGQDKNGAFQVRRRFNQFHQMRQAMKKAWPGCLIPSLPSKNPITKNEEQINLKRQRYLNDFLKKMALREYFYYCQQFQALLRSQEANLSDTFCKWPAPTVQSIILRYKEIFSALAGKQITQQTNDSILQFYKRLGQNQKQLIQYRKIAKQLAIRRDRYNKTYHQFIYYVRIYQQNIMSSLVSPKELLYTNQSQPQMLQHQKKIEKVTTINPFWLLYDLIKNQERDGRAFQQLLRSIEQYSTMAKDIQGKIESNLKGISEASAGKKNIKTMGMKGTADEIKYQLEVQNGSLKKEKDNTQGLRDIVIALVSFIEIQEYKTLKRQFYHITLQKLAKFQNNFTSVALKIWEDIQNQLERLVESLQ